jgi:hypothetical protein
MRNLKFGLVMMVSMALAGAAFAQGKMGMQETATHQMTNGNDTKIMKTMMMGLNKNQKMTAMNHMKHMSKAEKSAMMKRCSLCMADPHKGMTKDMKVTDKMVHDHMMNGMTKAQQATIMGMMKRMSAKEKAVAMKMVENCCWYGFKHAK